MSQTIALQGSLVVGGGCCSDGGAAVLNQCVRALGFPGVCGNQGLAFESVVLGRIVAASDGWTDVDLLDHFSDVEFLYALSSAPVRWRFDPLGAVLAAGAPPTFPIPAGAALDVQFAGAPTPVYLTFVAASSLADMGELTNALNAAYGAETAFGAAYRPDDGGAVFREAGGALAIHAPGAGYVSAVVVTAADPEFGVASGGQSLGTAETMPATAGVCMAQFDRQNAPSRVQVSGRATIDLVVGGKAS